MSMIIINTNDIEQTVREEFIKAIDESLIEARPSVVLSDLAPVLSAAIIARGNQTPAEKPIELVQEILERWGILRWSPQQRGRLIGELVRACLGIDSPNPAKESSAGECPDDDA